MASLRSAFLRFYLTADWCESDAQIGQIMTSTPDDVFPLTINEVGLHCFVKFSNVAASFIPKEINRIVIFFRWTEAKVRMCANCALFQNSSLPVVALV